LKKGYNNYVEMVHAHDGCKWGLICKKLRLDRDA